MAGFSLVPLLEDRDWSLDDPMASSRRRLAAPFAELNRMARQLERLQREMGMLGGIMPKKDAFEVDLDVQGYKPEDLNITVKDNELTISGSHEEKNEDGTHYQSRHFSRKFTLPENVEMDKMKSVLAADGRTLRVEAPLKQPAIEEKKEEPKEVPIAINRK